MSVSKEDARNDMRREAIDTVETVIIRWIASSLCLHLVKEVGRVRDRVGTIPAREDVAIDQFRVRIKWNECD